MQTAIYNQRHNIKPLGDFSRSTCMVKPAEGLLFDLKGEKMNRKMIKLKASKTYCCGIELDYIADRLRHAAASGTTQTILCQHPKAGQTRYLSNLDSAALINDLRKHGYKYYPCEHADKTGRCVGV